MIVYSLICEREELFDFDGITPIPKRNFEEIMNRYKKGVFVQSYMGNLYAWHFFNVGDRDSMYNELVNSGFDCYRVKYPIETVETPESVELKSRKAQKKAEKEMKKLKRIVEKMGEDL